MKGNKKNTYASVCRKQKREGKVGWGGETGKRQSSKSAVKKDYWGARKKQTGRGL